MNRPQKTRCIRTLTFILPCRERRQKARDRYDFFVGPHEALRVILEPFGFAQDRLREASRIRRRTDRRNNRPSQWSLRG